MTEKDRKEIETRQAILEKLKKKLNDLTLSRKCQKYRLDRKQKLDALDEIRSKKVTGNLTAEPGLPQKVDSAELMEATCRIDIPCSVAHE